MKTELYFLSSESRTAMGQNAHSLQIGKRKSFTGSKDMISGNRGRNGKGFAQNGAKVVLSARRGDRLRELAGEIGENAVYCGTKHFVRAMLDSFRMEAVAEGTNIHATTIYPGAVKTELLNTIAPSETKAMVEKFYEDAGLTPDVIANAVLYASSQPDNVNVSDLVVRPNKEA